MRAHDVPRLRHKLPSARVSETHGAAIHTNPWKLRLQVDKGRPPRTARGRLLQHYLAPAFRVHRAQQPAQVLLDASVAPPLRSKVGRLFGVSLVFWFRRFVVRGRRPDHSRTCLPKGFLKLLCPRARDQVKAIPPTVPTSRTANFKHRAREYAVRWTTHLCKVHTFVVKRFFPHRSRRCVKFRRCLAESLRKAA